MANHGSSPFQCFLSDQEAEGGRALVECVCYQEVK